MVGGMQLKGIVAASQAQSFEFKPSTRPQKTYIRNEKNIPKFM
jgi:hypothetical protein